MTIALSIAGIAAVVLGLHWANRTLTRRADRRERARLGSRLGQLAIDLDENGHHDLAAQFREMAAEMGDPTITKPRNPKTKEAD